MESNLNKNIDESLKTSNSSYEENTVEKKYDEKEFQDKIEVIKLQVKEEQQEIKEEGEKENKNQGYTKESEEEELKELDKKEEKGEIEEEEENEREETEELEQDNKRKYDFNENNVSKNDKESNYFLENYSSNNNNIFTNKDSDYKSVNKNQYEKETLLFDSNENEEIIKSNDNIMKTNIESDDADEQLREKNKKKKDRINKKKRNLSDNESNEADNEDIDEKDLKKQKKQKFSLKKNKYIANAAEEGEEEEEEEEEKEEEDDYISNDNDMIKKKSISKKRDKIDSIADEDEYEMEREDSNKLQKKKKNHFDEILENLKFRRKRTPKISEDDGLQYCENVLNQMILVHEQDIKNMKEKKPATAKLQIIDEVCKILTKPKWKPFFMKLNIYHVLALWLMPTSKSNLPNFTIRTNLLKVIQQLPITIKSLRGSQLGKIMTYLHSHKDETEENKKLIRNILQNWMGPIIGINTNYKQFLKERQKKIMENPEYHKKILEKAKTLIPDSICIEKEEEQNEFKRHATIPYNSECSFLINVPSSIPNSSKKNVPKSKIKRLTDSMKLNKKCRKTQKVSIEGKGVAVAP